MAECTRTRPSAVHSNGTISTNSEAGNTTSEDFRNAKLLYDQACKATEQALCYDEQGLTEQAMTLYNKASKSIQNSSNCLKRCNSSGDREKSQKLNVKLSRLHEQVDSRMAALSQDSAVLRSLNDPPPSYEQASSTPSPLERDFTSLGDELSNEFASLPQCYHNATKLFSISDGAQIFYISNEGNVSAPSYPSSLNILKMKSGDAERLGFPACLQIGDLIYPLKPGASPALLAENGTYILPVPEIEQGASVGILLPPSVVQGQRVKFQETLTNLCNLRTEENITQDIQTLPRDEQESTTSKRIAAGIITGADWLSKGLVAGASKSGELLRRGSAQLKTRLTPEDPKDIDPRIITGLSYAKTAGKVAYKVTGCIVSAVGYATVELGKKAAPHVAEQAKKVLPESWTRTDSADGRSKMDGAVEIAAGGLAGFSTVYVSLVAAGKTLCKSMKNETVSIINHKYGVAAADVTDHTLSTVGFLALTAHNVDNLGVKAIAKRFAKDTGSALITGTGNGAGGSVPNATTPPQNEGSSSGASYNGSATSPGATSPTRPAYPPNYYKK